MASEVDEFGNPVILRSPRQASRIYGFDRAIFTTDPVPEGSTVPRPKFLFYVNFLRGNVGLDPWVRAMGFSVKEFDRPAVSPVTQELNQYNKKRIVHTGYKMAPFNITLYDTVDNNLMRMWNEYTQWHFGDFRQGDATLWSYDITTDAGIQDAGFGFGFAPQMRVSPDDANFFFSRVEIYQFFGLTYTQFDLVNPKITAFAPDGMSYEDNSPPTIKLTMEFESIIYQNQNMPVPIAALRPDLQDLLANSLMASDVVDPPGANLPMPFPIDPTLALSGAVSLRLGGPIENLFGTASTVVGGTFGSVAISANSNGNVQIQGGALASFGSFNFGAALSNAPSPQTGFLAGAMRSNFSTAGGALFNGGQTSTLSAQILGSTPIGPNTGINGQSFGVAAGIVGGVGGIAPGISAGITLAAAAQGNSVREHASATFGLSLSPAAFGTINAQRPAYSQYGTTESTQPWLNATGGPSMMAVSPLLNATPADQPAQIIQNNPDGSVTTTTFGPAFEANFEDGG